MSRAEVINGTKDSDIIEIKGESGFREITGYGDDDIITGGNGINIIYGDGKFPLGAKESLGDDEYKELETIYKKFSGNDTIKGGNGVNIIHAGLGDDEITGGAGVNLIQFKAGDGNDIICNGNGTDYLYFCDWSYDNAAFSKNGNDLIISYKDADTMEINPDMGSVTLKDYFIHKENFSIQGIGFGANNPTEYKTDIEPIGSMLNYDDNITIDKLAGAIQSAFKNSAEIWELFNEDKNVIEMETSGKVTGSNGDDIIKGSGGDDTIYGGNGNDIIKGGEGNDKLYGGRGKNTFIFDDGDGKDTIYYQNGEDIIDITKAATIDGKTEFAFFKENNDLIIKYGSGAQNGESTDEIRLVNYFKSNGKSNIQLKFIEDNIKTIKDIKDLAYINIDFSKEIRGKTIVGTFLDDNIKGTDKNDLIKGGNGDDTIEGGKGNDRLYGEGGKNTFVFNKGDGKDTVYSGKGEDTIKFKDIKAIETDGVKNVKFSATGNNLIIHYGSEDTVTIPGYLANPSKSSVKYIQFQENPPKLITDLLNQYPFEFDGNLNKRNSIRGTNSKDIITGGGLNDTINALGGDDIIFAGDGADLVRGGNGDDLIYGEGGNDRLYGDNGNDTIYGGDGNDIIYGGNGDDVIYGGAGDDKLYGDAGNNTFHFIKGDGNDIVYSGRGADTLSFDDVNFSDLTYSLSKTNGLSVNYGNGGTVDISGYFSRRGKVSTKKIITKDGEKTLDEIVNDKNFKVLINGNENKRNTLRGTYKNDIITGGNLNDTILGNDGDDIIFGRGGNDLIRGGNGDDTIEGGKGNDRLYGEGGKNTFVFNKGDGADIIYSGRGEDTIKFADIKEFDSKTMYFSAKGNNLIINYGTGDNITIPGYLANPAKSSVKYIQFTDGDKISISDLIKNHPFEFYGTQGKRNSIRGTNEVDIIKGGNLNDTITALGGDDIIFAGDGADLVRGGNGDDLIYGEGGNDRLYGDNGNDTIYGGDGNDIIYGGNGDDIIYGGTGDDKLYGDAGNNTFYFKEGDGADTIYMNSRASDTIVFDKSLKDTLTFDRAGNNLIIKYGANGDSVTILNYLNNKNPSIKNIVFADYDTPKGDFSKEEGMLLSDIVIKKLATKFNLANGKTVNGEYYKGNEYNNLIISTGVYSKVEAGEGDDIIYLQSRNAEVYGGEGDDKYIVSSLGSNTKINDTTGSDMVKILDKKQNVKVLFDVKVSNDGSIINSDPDFDSMFIINNATFNRIKSTGKLNITSGIEIEDFSNGISTENQNRGINKIETNNGYLDLAGLNSVKQDVANWLAGSNGKYESAMDVLAGGNKTDIKELLAIYQNVENKWI